MKAGDYNPEVSYKPCKASKGALHYLYYKVSESVFYSPYIRYTVSPAFDPVQMVWVAEAGFTNARRVGPRGRLEGVVILRHTPQGLVYFPLYLANLALQRDFQRGSTPSRFCVFGAEAEKSLRPKNENGMQTTERSILSANVQRADSLEPELGVQALRRE